MLTIFLCLVGYLVVAIPLAVVIGKALKRAREEQWVELEDPYG